MSLHNVLERLLVDDPNPARVRLKENPVFVTDGTQDELYPAFYIARTDVAKALVGDTSEQSMFATAGDALTVAAGDTYLFRCVGLLTTGATAVTVTFSLAGTATFTTSNAISFGIHAASGTAGTAAMNNSADLNTGFVVVASGTGVNKRFLVEGQFEVNAAGTVIPSVTFSADPQGDETVDLGSYFQAIRLGSNPITAIGAWV
jgi:hypothetical protein